MNILDELARLAPDTAGPDTAATEAARADLAAAMRGRGRRSGWPRRRRIVTIATAVAVAGAGAAAAAAIRDKGSRIEFAEYRTSVRLSDTKVLQLWAAPRANGQGWPCPYLRIDRVGVRHGDGQVCGFGFADYFDDAALSVQSERLDAEDVVALYGHAPVGAENVVVVFADGSSQRVTVRRGWFVTTVPDTSVPTRVTATASQSLFDASVPPPLPRIAGAQGPTCSSQGSASVERPVPIRIPKPGSAPGTAKYADAKLILQGRPLPDVAWGLLLMRDRGDAFLSLRSHGENDEERGSMGGGFSSSLGRLGASAGTLSDDTWIVLGASSTKTTCVVATDSLGRTTATTRLVRDNRFPKLRFWAIVVPDNATVTKIEAFAKDGRRIDTTRFRGLSGHNTAP